MSLGARRFFIEQLRIAPDIKAVLQPLVCTHAGFTGLSYREIPDYIEYSVARKQPSSYLLWGKPKIYRSNTPVAFNPSSINLYNEDILAILNSGGIIGLSLDKRILGYSEPNSRPEAMNDLAFEEEYISNEEKKYFLNRRKTGSKLNDEYCITTAEVLQGGEVNPDASFYHLCHFMAHILHLIKVATENNYDVSKALTQICIGSDFDGIINPVWCCTTVEQLADFKQEFILHFPWFTEQNSEIVLLPPGFDITRFADQLFYENGKDFLLERLLIN